MCRSAASVWKNPLWRCIKWGASWCLEFPNHMIVKQPVEEFEHFSIDFIFLLLDWLVGGLEHFLFSPIAGMMIQSD